MNFKLNLGKLATLILASTMLLACGKQAEQPLANTSEPEAVAERLVLVAGATGRTGQHVVNALVLDKVAVRVLTRSLEKAENLFGDAVQIHVTDVTDAESVAAAMVGVTDVVSAIGAGAPVGPNSPEFVDYGGTKNLVDAAVAANVDQFVLVSSLGASHPDHPLNAVFGNVMAWKLKGEDALRASGLDYTIVRPGGLSDDPAREQSLIFDQGDKLESGRISRADVAEVCVAALAAPGARNRTFEVVSEEGPTERDWVSLFGALQAD